MRVRAETTPITHRALVASAVELIERDLDCELGLEALAERAGVSAFHFHRLFRSLVGEPPATYVRRLRLERAAIALKYSRRPVTDIAFEAGYDTHESFTRAFKARFGTAPRRFRLESRRLMTEKERPYNDFFLAMTYARLGDRPIAEMYFRKALESLGERPPAETDLKAIHEEGVKTLGEMSHARPPD